MWLAIPRFSEARPNDYYVPAGLFQDGIEFEFKEQIFIDRKPSYYEFANQTSNMTEAEVFAKFSELTAATQGTQMDSNEPTP